MEHKDVAAFESDAPLVVLHFFKDAERKAGEFDAIAAAIFVKQRLRLAGVGDAKFLAAFLPGCETGSHETAFDAAFTNELIHFAQHFGGLKFLRGETAHDADGDGAIKRGGGAFAADITKGDAELLRAVAQKFVEIAANFARGEIAGGHIDAKILGGNGAQESALNALGGLEIALEASFISRDLFVEAGVFERYGKIGGENGERLHVLVGEVIELRTLEVENADDAVLVHHRNGEFGARFGIHQEIAGIGGDIGNEHRFTKSGGGADDAFAGSDAKLSLDALTVFDVDAMTEDVLGLRRRA